MQIERLVSGKISLKDQEITINDFQQHKGVEIINYKKTSTGSSDDKKNLAVFEQLDLGEPISSIHLVEVPEGGDAVAKIAENLAAGRKIVFQEDLFVNSKVAKVLGFRDL